LYNLGLRLGNLNPNAIGNQSYKVKNSQQIIVRLREVWPEIKGETLLRSNASMHVRLDVMIKN